MTKYLNKIKEKSYVLHSESKHLYAYIKYEMVYSTSKCPFYLLTNKMRLLFFS